MYLPYFQFLPLICVFYHVPLCFFLLSLVPGELPKPNSTTPAVTSPAPTVQPHSCPDGQFACGAHRECVASSKVCDFRQDCSDGSDELNCGKHSSFLHSKFLHKQLPLWHSVFFTMLCLSLFSFPSSNFSHIFLCLLSFPSLLICLSLSAVKEQCDFEVNTCGWESVDSSLVPMHAFRWSPNQGESIHDGEEYHRPVNDHTL